MIPASVASSDGVKLEREQRLTFRTVPPFRLTHDCAVNAEHPCHPLQPIMLRFTHSLHSADAEAVRLQLPDGRQLAPERTYGETRHLSFAGPFPQLATLTIRLPAGLRDTDGRALVPGAGPMTLHTGPQVVQWMAPPPLAVLPAGAAPQATVRLPLAVPHALHRQDHHARILRVDGGGDSHMLGWIDRTAGVYRSAQSRVVPLLGKKAGSGSAPAAGVRTVRLERASPDPEHRSALPLPGKGLYIVEWLDAPVGPKGQAPHWLQSAVLVTDLALHVRQARDSSVAWVTSIGSGAPVANARISVHQPQRPVWHARTDQHGLVRIPTGTRQGAMRIIARTTEDVALAPVDLGWTWREFHHPHYIGDDNEVVTTVFDSMLVQPGATVHMKHLRRTTSAAGLGMPDEKLAPLAVTLYHHGSGRKYNPPVAWRGGQAAQDWQLPPDTPLGHYSVQVGPHYTGSFRVEAVSPAQTSATVQAPRRIWPGASVPAAILSVTDLNGGPARGAVSMRSTLANTYGLQFPAYPHAAFANGVPGQSELTAVPPGAPVRAQLGRDGSASFALPSVPKATSARSLQLEFSFPDSNGETRSTSHRLDVLPSEEVVGVQVGTETVDRNRGQVVAGAPLSVSALVVDSAGAARAGRPVHLTLIGTNQAQADICSGTTNNEGVLTCTLAAAPDETFIVVARSAQQPQFGAHLSVWPQKPGRATAKVLQLVAPPTPQAPNARARIGIGHGFSSGWMLTTVEREGILDAVVHPIRAGMEHVDLALTPAHAPNVTVHAIQSRARAALAPGQAFVASASTTVLVKPDAQALSVTVRTDRPAYRPGQTAQVDIDVRTRDGRALPAGAEVALAVIDAGVLELWNNTSWDLLERMQRPRWSYVRQLDNVGAIGAPPGPMAAAGLHMARASATLAAPAPASALRSAAEDPSSPRTRFSPQVLWRAAVKLDGEGRARVPVQLSDALSRFRIVAVAHAGADRFGHGGTEVLTRQRLELRSLLPPVVRGGDRLQARFVVRNRSERPIDATASVTLRYPDGTESTLPSRRIALAGGAVQELGWQVDVPAHQRGVLAWRAKVQAAQPESGSESDDGFDNDSAHDELRFEQTLLAPERARTIASALLQLDRPNTLPLRLPAGALDGQLALSLSARMDGGLPGVRRFFEHYRYGCFEQQLSAVVAIGERAGWDALMRKVGDYTDTSTGLLRYFPGGGAAGSDVLTSHILHLAAVRGFPLPASVENSLTQALGQYLAADSRTDGSPRERSLRRLAAMAALAVHGKASPEMVDATKPLLDEWPTASVIDWLTLVRGSRHPQAARLTSDASAQLRARLYTQGTALALSNDSHELRPWLMWNGDVTMARLLLAVRELPEWRAELPALARGLMARQRNGHWYTTLANAWGAVAMTAFAETMESGPVNGTTSVTVGEQRASHDWAGANTYAARFGMPAGAASLKLEHAGSGAPWASVHVSAVVPLAQERFTGIRIKKTLTPVEQQVKGQWTRGDVVRVRLELEARSDMQWVVIDDPVAPGATILGSGLGGDSSMLAQPTQWRYPMPSYQERARDSLRSYYAQVPGGHWTLEYTLRLNADGRFQLPATHAEAMYQPDVAGDLPNPVMVVEPGQ